MESLQKIVRFAGGSGERNKGKTTIPKKIKIYTDWSLRPTDNSMPAFLLYPCFKLFFHKEFNFSDKSEFRDTMRFESIEKKWNKYFSYVSLIDEADWIVLPSDWKYYVGESILEKSFNYIETMTKLNKRILIQYNSDDDLPNDIFLKNKNVHILRTSLNKSKCNPNEHVLPGFVGDPLKIYSKNKLIIHKKCHNPKVVFCGWANDIKMTIEELNSFSYLIDNNFSELNLKDQADHIYRFRGSVLNFVRQNNKINSEILVRNGYCAGIDKEKDEIALKRVRFEYFNNMMAGDYVICIRGKGNYSYRFYETLAMGRIPVLVDTDCSLPFLSLINWNKHCIIVDHHNVQNIGEIIIDYHSMLSESDFKKMQYNNRKLWEDMLVPEKFFYNFFNLQN